VIVSAWTSAGHGLLAACLLKECRAASESAPMKVEIVGLPTRETVSAITRNPDGDIVATSQIERDVD